MAPRLLFVLGLVSLVAGSAVAVFARAITPTLARADAFGLALDASSWSIGLVGATVPLWVIAWTVARNRRRFRAEPRPAFASPDPRADAGGRGGAGPFDSRRDSRKVAAMEHRTGPEAGGADGGAEPFGWSVEDGVAVLRLSRPQALNALTFEVYRALARRLHDLRSDATVRALVVTGEGRGFCSGGDVDEIIGALLERDAREVLEFARLTGEVVENLRRLDKPVVAAVNGIAAGAGAVIALACDLRVVADTASFAFLFTKVGLTGADMGAAWLLPRIVGLGRASEILLLGDKVDAETALRIGLANRVVPVDRVLPEATALARRLAQGPALAVGMTKRLLGHEAAMDLASAIELEAVAQGYLLRARDHREFYEARGEGRAPRFEGR